MFFCDDLTSALVNHLLFSKICSKKARKLSEVFRNFIMLRCFDVLDKNWLATLFRSKAVDVEYLKEFYGSERHTVRARTNVRSLLHIISCVRIFVNPHITKFSVVNSITDMFCNSLCYCAAVERKLVFCLMWREVAIFQSGFAPSYTGRWYSNIPS